MWPSSVCEIIYAKIACLFFKVKTTNPKKYCVRPNTGIVTPRSTCDVIVTMQAQKEAPADMQCKDKFLLQSVKTVDGTSPKDITADMFNKEAGHVVEECKLRVLYVSPPQPPSPVPEGSEEGSSPRGSVSENGNANGSDFTQAARGFTERPESQDKSAEARALISRLTEEKNNAIQQNSKLHQELVRIYRATEEGRQQKSWWSLICHCRINWLAWHNYGVSHEEDLSISAIQSFTIVFDLSFFVPTIQAIMRKVKIDQFSRCWFFFFIFAVSFLFFGWITFWR
eukprot:XP_014630800.1 vesicle-associated protein isoform X2 [Glycine max]